MRNLNDDKNKREQILTDGEQKQRFREGLHKFPQNITAGNPAQKRMAIDQSVLAKRGRDAARMLGVEHLNASELDDFLFHDQHDFLSAVPERNARGVYVPRTQDERRFVAFNELARLQLAAKDGGKGLSGASVYAPQEEEDAGKALLAELAEKGWPFAGIASRSKTPTEDDAAPQPMPLRAPDPQDVHTPEAPADDTPPRPMPLGTPSPVATPAPTDTPDPTEQQENAEEQEATTGKGSTSASEKKDKLIANLELFLGRKLTTEEMTLLTGPTYKGESLQAPSTPSSGAALDILRPDKNGEVTFYDKNRSQKLDDKYAGLAQEVRKHPHDTINALRSLGQSEDGVFYHIPKTEESQPYIDNMLLFLISEGYDIPNPSAYQDIRFLDNMENGFTIVFNSNADANFKVKDGENAPTDVYTYSFKIKEHINPEAGDVADFIGNPAFSILQFLYNAYRMSQGLQPIDTPVLSQFLDMESLAQILPRAKPYAYTLECIGGTHDRYEWDFVHHRYKSSTVDKHGSVNTLRPLS
ncbi:hypothetical protein [Beduinella massiliensis]|uniref:hypothetical protein n=1 Tax=Beduinella massiliensis TaxID=1852363 RepID=UPI000C861F8D